MRWVAVALALVALAGCKKQQDQAKLYLEDITDMCNAPSRSGARTATEMAAWMDKRARTARFRGEMSALAALDTKAKWQRVEDMAKAAGVLDCPFAQGWREELAKSPPPMTPAERCDKARALYTRQIAAATAQAIEAAVEADRPRLEADALGQQERIKARFATACQSLGDFDPGCLEPDRAAEAECQALLARLRSALSEGAINK